MLDGQRSEMRIGNEITGSLRVTQHPGELNAMALSRRDDANNRQVEPVIDMAERFIER